MPDTPKSLSVYRASAGSGKTFTLAARYIALLLNNVSFRSILAVTFTNKATAEMKQRILSNLHKIGTGELGRDSAFMKKVEGFMPSGTLPNDLQTKAKSILTQILNDYDHFAVRTIDSFLQILLAGLAHRLHLRANYEIDLDTDSVINKSVDLMLKNYKNESDEVRKKIDNFLEDNLHENKSPDIRKTIKKLCRQLTKEDFLINEDIISDSVDTHDKVMAYRKSLQNYLDNTFITPLKEQAALFDRQYSHYPWRASVARSIRTFMESIREYLQSPYTASPKLLATTVRNKLADEDLWEKECTDIHDTLPSMALLNKLENLVRTNIPEVNSVQLSLQHLHELCLLSRVQELMDKIEREKDSTMLSKAPVTLFREMQTGDAEFILEKAGIRYSHIMIDEFQDTSRLQWELFKPLVREILDKGGTVLIVGDVKQSIYRWRGGDWKLLKEIDSEEHLGEYFRNDMGEILQQKRNFRSHENIVRFNLSLFKFISEQMDSDIAEKYSAYKGIIKDIYDEQFRPEILAEYYKNQHSGGYVSIDFHPYRKTPPSSDIIIGNMMDQINDLVRHDVPMSDISILVRSHHEAGLITEFLTKNHKPDATGPYDHLDIVSSEAFRLSSSVSVNILINAMRFLQTQNNIALFYVIYHYQHNILNNNIGWEEIRQRYTRQDYAGMLPSGYIESTTSNGTTTCSPCAYLKELPLYEMAERLARMFLYTDNADKPLEDDAYILCLFDHITAFSRQNISDLDSFLDYWDDTLCEKTIQGISTGIQILTIHKAKGLENGNIFVPFCDFDILNRKFKDNNIWCSPPNAPYNGMPLLPIQTVKKAAESIYADNYNEEVFMQHIDSINTLYVALTRAKRNLFISGKYDVEGNSPVNNIMFYLQSYLNKTDIERYPASVFEEAATDQECITYQTGEIIYTHTPQENNCIPLRLQHLEERYEFRQSTDSYSFLYPDEKKYNTEACKHGQQLHLIYSAIDTVQDTDDVIALFRKQGIIASDIQAGEISRIIRNSWENKLAASWFDGSWTLFRECSILERGPEGEHKQHRPDRVMIKNDQCIVVDFKFAQRSEEHKEQVRRYMALMKKMGFNNTTGYLWYIGEHTTDTIEITL